MGLAGSLRLSDREREVSVSRRVKIHVVRANTSRTATALQLYGSLLCVVCD